MGELRKMTLSVGLFEESEDTRPQRVANISFVSGPKSFVRVAVKESGSVVFDQKLAVEENKTREIIRGGEELLYAPDKLLYWVLNFLRDEFKSRSPLLANLIDIILGGKREDREGREGKNGNRVYQLSEGGMCE